MYCKHLFFSGRTFSLSISRCMVRTKHYEAIFIVFYLFLGRMFLVSNQLIIGKSSVLWRSVLSCLMVHALRCMYSVPRTSVYLRVPHLFLKRFRPLSETATSATSTNVAKPNGTQNKTKQSGRWCACRSAMLFLVLSHTK